MRVTPGMTADNALFNLQKGRTLLNRIQEQIASGLTVNRPSDDPITTRQVLDLENKLDKGEQYLSNITKSNLWLNMTETALQGISDIVTQVKKVAGTITSGSSDVTVRETAASQIKELKKQLIDIANTQMGDQFIFAGFKNDAPPFTTADNTYRGTADQISVEIDQNSTSAMNLTGDALLKGTGGYGSIDILTAMDDLVTAINANNPTDISNAAAQLDASSNQITNARSDVASRIIRLDSAKTMITRNQNTISGIISDTLGVDYMKAATELNQQQTAFEAALSATAKISQLSLLDYIR